MNITLTDIEKAVRRNFVLKHDGAKLETVYDWESNSRETARLVFVGIAIERGFHMDDICAFLDMNFKDFLSKCQRYKDYLHSGHEKVEEMKRMNVPLHRVLDKIGADALDMRVWRKTILVNNYLRLVLQSKTLELLETLPNYVN
jgi:hypothetical protein